MMKCMKQDTSYLNIYKLADHERLRIQSFVCSVLLMYIGWCANPARGVGANFFSYDRTTAGQVKYINGGTIHDERPPFWRWWQQHNINYGRRGWVDDAAADDHIRSIQEAGLSYIYYINSCPRAYDVVRERMQFYMVQDPSHAAGILRLFFHDCFVQGCDASVLLERPATEHNADPNINSLRATSFRVIDEIKASLEVVCPGVVSCADTLALAARDAIFMVGGPWIPILTGRKDSSVAASNLTVTSNIPQPTQDFSALKQNFAAKGLTVKDLVALSGAHTIGQTHCRVVSTQLTPTISADLSPSFAANLSRICLGTPSSRSHLTVHLDGMTPNTFDNTFYKNALLKRAIFHSDAALLTDPEAMYHVRKFAYNKAEFFEQFKLSFTKMSQIGVLKGGKGEVRMSCTIPN